MNILSPLIVTGVLVFCGVAVAQNRTDKITVSPTLQQATPAEARAVDAAAVANMAPGLTVIGADGQTVGRVIEVVRTPEGQINRVLIDAADGKRRALSGAAIRFSNGRALTTMTPTEVLELEVVKP